jgi:4'-phosphopantetheinyl transferase
MPHHIDVHTLDLDRPDLDLNRLYALLDDEELERSRQFHSDQLRRRYIARRGQLRELLSRYNDQSPADIRFVNLSHSLNVCLVAIGRSGELGCDVERRDPTFPSEDIARAFFAPGEVRALETLDRSQQVEAFFNCWTRKEAYIKARGYGVSLPLDSFEVSLAPGEPPALLSGCDGWSVKSFEPVPGFQGAVVAQGTEWQLKLSGASRNRRALIEPNATRFQAA